MCLNGLSTEETGPFFDLTGPKTPETDKALVSTRPIPLGQSKPTTEYSTSFGRLQGMKEPGLQGRLKDPHFPSVWSKKKNTKSDIQVEEKSATCETLARTFGLV